MTTLTSRALARLPLTAAEVEAFYATPVPTRYAGPIGELAESHERLRAELAGAEAVIADREAEAARLRAALEAIAEDGCDDDWMHDRRSIARKALAGEAT